MHKDSVTIVGAGPSGLAAALWLVRAGIAVTVLERSHGIAEDMRASTFHPSTLDLLHESGIAARLLEQGTPATQWQYLQYHEASGEEPGVVFDLGLIAEDTRYPFRLQCEQFRLTYAIACELRDHRLFRLLRGCQLTAVQQDDQFVAFDYEQAGALVQQRSRWLIAADGAHSSVRQSLQLPFEGAAFPRTSITLVMDYPFERHFKQLLGVNYVWSSDSHFSLMRVRDRWRFTYSPSDDESTREALQPERIRQRLEAWFPDLGKYTVDQCNHYTLHQRCLERFRHGRVLFIGDSAHLNSPAGGLGMNSGIHDAHCLVEHLLPVLDGEDPQLLDRYDRRRSTIAREQVQRLSARNYAWHRERDPQKRQSIWEQLQATAASPQKAREFLLQSSLIDSRRREGEID